MPTLHLPRSLAALFPGAPRHLDLEADDLDGLIEALDERYPGMRDRLCEPGPRLRPHINAWVDGQPASLATPLNGASVVHIFPAVSGGSPTPDAEMDARATRPCRSCATHNPAVARFCNGCGERLIAACPGCGDENPQAARFCNACGTALPGTAARGGGEPAPAHSPEPTVDGHALAAERRHVSVVFADLVGFTSLAQDRDPEAVRELLARYFETCREIIERYGGALEKFIGDAVMAVWGAPVAREDDPERAVRAALDLVAAVRGLGADASGRPLAARAAVLSGEAAVTIGAAGQGMVAGDLVNTASRLQSVAPSGAVLVGESTCQLTQGAIAYEPVGEQQLKGRSAPVSAWRAVRVTAKRGGVGRAEGLEPPFVGREEQLRLLKDLLHAAWRDRRLRFVSIIGQPGTGKSRLVWELYKYIDGLVEDVYWHQGRSPAYGEGITFWALGEMVRKRAGLAEADDAATTRQRIGEMLSEFVPDEGERRWMEPKLLGLLGQGEMGSLEREELFAAWRTLFERVSRKGVTVLVFEDTHHADQGVLDFIEHMAEWSTDHPILLVTLARHELHDRRPDWGVGRRGFTALTLDPLPDARMEELLAGLVTGLPRAARQAILERADGVPLYAVEMVRKLLLDGRLERQGDTLAPRGDLTRLEVPTTLHALIAARLDALGPSERSLLGVASVLGQSFSPAALAAVMGESDVDLGSRLRDLVKRDILAQNRDPRSPERGQFAFVQALIREVAYGTLSRRDRRARHLAAARYFESLGDEELAGALATHYLDAYRASEPGAEADAIAAQARIALRAAAERATTLHSPEQALAYLVPALEVTRDEAERAALLELAGEAARRAARSEEAAGFLEQAKAAYRTCGDRSGAIRVTTTLGLLHTAQGRPGDAIAVLTPTLDGATDLGESREVLALRAALARAHLFADDHAMALALIDQALVSAGRTDDVAIVTDAIVTKGTVLMYMQRYWEGVAMMSGGLDLAQLHGLVLTELRARLNMSFSQATDDPRLALETARTGLERARRLGLRDWSLLLAGNAADPLFVQGEWDAVIGLATDLAIHAETSSVEVSDLPGVALAIRALRGETENLEEDLRRFAGNLSAATATQEQTISQLVHLWVDLARGRLTQVVERDLGSLDPGNGLNCHKVVGHAALWTRDLAGARRAAGGIEGRGATRRWSSAVALGLQSGIAALEGHARDAEDGYREAVALLADLGAVRDLALLHMDRVATASDPGVAREAADAARPPLSRMGAAALEDRLERLLGRWAVPRPDARANGPGRPGSRDGLADRSEVSAPA